MKEKMVPRLYVQGDTFTWEKYVFVVVKSTEDACLLRKKRPDLMDVTWEVCVLTRLDYETYRKIAPSYNKPDEDKRPYSTGIDAPPGYGYKLMPPTSEWGEKAWSYTKEDDALLRYYAIVNTPQKIWSLPFRLLKKYYEKNTNSH